MIFVDGHRPKKKAIAKSRDRWRKKYPDVDEHFTETCIPSALGPYQAIQAVSDVPTRIYNLTVGFDQPDETLAEVGRIQGAKLHIDAEEVTDEIPREFDPMCEWFMEDYKQKNARLKGRRGIA